MRGGAFRQFVSCVMRSRGVFFAALAVSALFSTAAFAGVTISIDKSMQQMSVSVDGVKRYTWPVSTGRAVSPTIHRSSSMIVRCPNAAFASE